MAPNEDVGNYVEGPSDKYAMMGPMALSYNPKEGWVATELSLKSKHWKRLAREANPNKPIGKKRFEVWKKGGPNLVTTVGSQHFRPKTKERSEME